VIEWGDGIYGAEAAARTYFGRPAADLGAFESALLAGAIVNPRILTPGRPTARLRRRQQMIMRRMGAASPPAAVVETPTGTPLAPDGGTPEPIPVLPQSAAPAGLPGEPVPSAPAPPVRPCDRPPCG